MSTTNKPLCICQWRGERCTDPATQEDGMCDWCAPRGCANTTGGHIQANEACWMAYA